MNNISLSVGYLDRAVRLLRIIEHNPTSSLSKIGQILKTDDIIFRGNSKSIISIALEVGWISVNDDYHVAVNEDILLMLDGDMITLQRELFWTYIEHKRPIWTKYLSRGVEKAKNSILNENEKQIFHDLGLFVELDNTEKTVISWWAKARALARTIEQNALTEIGNYGELLSLKYEKHRTKGNPFHVAYYSDSFGYDIESVVSDSDNSQLYIEVKSTTRSRNTAKLFITRNEYEICKKHIENYVFHLWELTNQSCSLLVVKSSEILSRVPSDSEGGLWETASIKFKEFEWNGCQQFEGGWNEN